MGNKLTERMDRLRKQRSKWRKQVEAAETDWTDCANEDREEMRAELTAHLAQLDADIQAGTTDDFTKADLLQRTAQLRQRLDVEPLQQAVKTTG